MTDFIHVYEREPEAYDRLVSAEDVDGRVRAALEAVVPLEGARVLEVGVGTARIARQLVQAGSDVTGFDLYAPMLGVARRRLGEVGPEGERWRLGRADLKALPVATGWADLAVAGWVFGHQRFWNPQGWRGAIDAGVGAMQAAVRPGGAVVLLETQGTGATAATPPEGITDVEAYFGELGFEGQTLRTDYVFESAEDAAATLGFFFGDEFASKILAESWARVPECTGFWVCRV